MKRKRDRIEIIHDVLVAIRDKGPEAKPTHVLYRSNLSSQMLNEYIKDLMEKGLIEKNTGKTITYNLTERGFKYIRDFSMIRDFMESYDLE
ncbi:MAG: winged helix-turn-helix domain-containing protein [Nanobdellota archaeon]